MDNASAAQLWDQLTELVTYLRDTNPIVQQFRTVWERNDFARPQADAPPCPAGCCCHQHAGAAAQATAAPTQPQAQQEQPHAPMQQVLQQNAVPTLPASVLGPRVAATQVSRLVQTLLLLLLLLHLL